MKKKFIITIFIVIIILIILFIIGCTLNKTNNISVDAAIKMIDQKETFNLYITDESKSAENETIKFYNDVYSLENKTINVNKITDKEYKKILKKLYIEKNMMYLPAMFQIKDGIVTSSIIGYRTENVLKDYLINNKIISEKYKDTDNFIYTPKELNNKTILLIGDNTETLYKLRKELLRHNKEYRIVSDNEESKEIMEFIDNNVKKYELPMLALVSDGRINYFKDDLKKSNLKRTFELLENQ